MPKERTDAIKLVKLDKRTGFYWAKNHKNVPNKSENWLKVIKRRASFIRDMRVVGYVIWLYILL